MGQEEKALGCLHTVSNIAPRDAHTADEQFADIARLDGSEVFSDNEHFHIFKWLANRDLALLSFFARDLVHQRIDAGLCRAVPVDYTPWSSRIENRVDTLAIDGFTTGDESI